MYVVHNAEEVFEKFVISSAPASNSSGTSPREMSIIGEKKSFEGADLIWF